jgi:hypothetical protein
LIGERLQNVPATTYLLASATSTLVLWAITCAVVFDNPVEKFLNIVLSDAKKQSTVETQIVTEKSEVIDSMCETIESNNQTLAYVKDMMCNIRTDVKEIQPLADMVEKMKIELGHLKREFERLEKTGKGPFICSNCGKPLSHEFRLCPFCGEDVKILPKKIVSWAVKAYQ